MPSRRIRGEDIPKAGEPLTVLIDPHNQEVLQRELAERAARQAVILTPRALRPVLKRYKQLHAELNRVGWNSLVEQRAALVAAFDVAKADYSAKQDELAAAIEQGAPESILDDLKQDLKQIRVIGRDLAEHGKRINAEMAQLRPLAEEFRQLAERLAAHEQAVYLIKEEEANKKAFAREAYTWYAQMKAAFRQDDRLHYTWRDTKGRSHTQTPKFSGIIFSEDKVLFRILTSTPGWFGTWRDHLPPNVRPKILEHEDTLSRLEAATGRVVTVDRGQRDQAFYYRINRPDSPDGIPRLVQYNRIIEWYPTELHPKTPWCAGLSEDRRDIWYTFEEEPHVLIAGSTRSGKSNLINEMVATLVTMNTPNEVRLVLIDNKGGVEFVHWAGLHHLLMPTIKEPTEVLPALQQLSALMRKRQRTFEAALTKKLIQYNATASEPIPRIIVLIDEMTTLLGLRQMSNDIQAELRLLSSQGAAFGIHLVLCTQHSSVDVLPGWTKTNMVLRAAGKMPSDSASRTILDSGSAAKIADTKGRFVFAVGREERVVQVPLILDASIARAVEISQEYPRPAELNQLGNVSEPAPAVVELSEPEPEPLMNEQVFLRIAINELGGALSPSRMFEVVDQRRIGLHLLRKIYKGLITRDEIEFEGVRYYRRKIRQGHYLFPIEQPIETPIASTEDNAASSDDLLEPVASDQDTEGIEPCEPLESSVA